MMKPSTATAKQDGCMVGCCKEEDAFNEGEVDAFIRLLSNHEDDIP